MKRTAIGTVAAMVAVTVGVTSAFGAPLLTSIGVLTPGPGGSLASSVNAVSPDGTYAVGYSNGSNLSNTGTISQAVIWSASSGLVQIPNAADGATSAHGVVVNSTGDLEAAGYYYDSVTFDYRMAVYTTPTSNLAGGSWTGFSKSNQVVGPYNAARTITWSDNSTSTGIAGRYGSSNRAIVQYKPPGVGGAQWTDYQTTGNTPPGANAVANTVSSMRTGATSNYAVAAGYDDGNPGALKRAVFMTGPNGTYQTIVGGGSGFQSEVLGMSPDTKRQVAEGGGVLVGYDQDTTTNHYSHAFYWNVGDVSMTFLGERPGDLSSTAIDVRRIGGNMLIGGSSSGLVENAVVWDTTGIWDTTGQAQVVQDILAAAGVDVSDWVRLIRVTSMSDDGKTLAGYGMWAADGSTRGFVATIPEPATLSLLGVGVCALLRRRR